MEHADQVSSNHHAPRLPGLAIDQPRKDHRRRVREPALANRMWVAGAGMRVIKLRRLYYMDVGGTLDQFALAARPRVL